MRDILSVSDVTAGQVGHLHASAVYSGTAGAISSLLAVHGHRRNEPTHTATQPCGRPSGFAASSRYVHLISLLALVDCACSSQALNSCAFKPLVPLVDFNVWTPAMETMPWL